MLAAANPRRIALLSGAATALYVVIAPVAVLIALSTAVVRITGSFEPENPAPYVAALAALTAGLGALWGRRMARLTGARHTRHMAAAGALSTAPAVGVAIVLLTALDQQFHVFRTWGVHRLPVHEQYRVFFVTSAFIVGALCALALSLTATTARRALRNAVLTGIVSAASFLLAVLALDLIGYRVGSGSVHPGPLPDVPAMPAVTIASAAVGALAGGALLGWLLNRDGPAQAAPVGPAPQPAAPLAPS